jgi:Ca-activated chloride channel homolog
MIKIKRKREMTPLHQKHIWLISALMMCFAASIPGQDKKAKQPPLFRVDVETVYLKASVVDHFNRNVTGLEKANFKVYEDNIEQEILHFSQESAPISLGFIFDVSGSMSIDNNIRTAKNWFNQLVQTGNHNPGDEYFLITFSRKIYMLRDFTDDLAGLQNDIAVQKSRGWTALYDAVYRGIDKIKEGRNEKKALVIISDGGENKSRYRFSELRDLAVESDVQIYAIGISASGNSLMKSLVELTGGRIFNSDTYGGMAKAISRIHTDLRTQYLLGYIPSNGDRNGKWRSIQVKLERSPEFPRVIIRARRGYYAPKF